MSEHPEQLKEYRQGDTVHLTVELRDEHGVHSVLSSAFLLVDGEPDEEGPWHRLDLSGWPVGTPTQAEVTLTGVVEQQPPGVYECVAIVAENVYHALTRHELNPPMRFRIVEHPDDVRQGPQVLSVGTFR